LLSTVNKDDRIESRKDLAVQTREKDGKESGKRREVKKRK